MSNNLTNRKLAALQTRKKLVDTAKQIICEKGLVNTSIGEITRACGVSSGTFYTYFKRKEDIVYEISKEMFSEIYDKAQSYNGSFTERLIYFMKSFSEYIENSGLKLCQEWVRNNVDPDMIKTESKMYMDIDLIKCLILNGVERGELKHDIPSEILAHTLVDVLYGQMLCWDMSGGEYSFAKRTKEFCDIFLSGIINQYLVEKG